MLFKGKTLILSGGTRGIGRAIALEFAKEGANISFNFYRSDKEAHEVEKEIKSLGAKAKAYKVDIKDYAAVKLWLEKTKELFGGLDIVVNNAGIIKDKALVFMEPEDWQEVLDINLGGTINLSRAAIVTLVKQKSGNIINITSVSGVVGRARQTNYSASKAGIIGFTKSLAKEVAAYNVRVNAVAPGFIETDMLKDLKEEYKSEIMKHIPLARFGKPQDVAGLVKFLASDAADFITGQTIIIDGGLSIS